VHEVVRLDLVDDSDRRRNKVIGARQPRGAAGREDSGRITTGISGNSLLFADAARITPVFATEHRLSSHAVTTCRVLFRD
jgi:hypothetical protein